MLRKKPETIGNAVNDSRGNIDAVALTAIKSQMSSSSASASSERRNLLINERGSAV
jgi:hypothetical protein